MRISKLSIFLLGAVTAFAACDRPGDDDSDAVPADSAAVATDSAATQEQLPAGPVVTDLDDVNDSGIDGEATATHSAQDVTVSILLKGKAKPDVSYPAHIHTGNCKDGGPVAVELGTVQNLQSSKTIPTSSLPADKAAFVQVHGTDGKPVACGNMKGHDDDRMMGDSAHATTTRY